MSANSNPTQCERILSCLRESGGWGEMPTLSAVSGAYAASFALRKKAAARSLVFFCRACVTLDKIDWFCKKEGDNETAFS